MLHNRLTLLGGALPKKETTLKVLCLITPCIISFSTVLCNVETIKCEWKIKSVSEYKYWYEDRSWKQMSCFNSAGAHIARKQSALECVYLRERTSLIVVCWKLHVSLIVCRLFRTPSVFFAPHRFCNTTSSSNLATKYVCPGVTFLSLWVPHSSSSSSQLFLLSHHHYCGGFIALTGKLWAWCLHFNFELWFTPNFFHNHRHWQSPSYYSSPPSYHLNHHHQKGHIAHRHSKVVVLKMVLEHSFRKN